LVPACLVTGTTIIGTDDGSKNGSAVVDTNCKVYGTDNLFVVDAGMHADLPSGNTHVIVMVAAEHAVKRIIALDRGEGGYNGTVPTAPVASSSAVLAPAPTTGSGGGYDTGSSPVSSPVAVISTPAVIPSPIAEASSSPAAQTLLPSAAPVNPGSGYDTGSGSDSGNTEEPHPTIPSATAAPDAGNGYEVPSASATAAEASASPSATGTPEEKKWSLSEFISWLQGKAQTESA
jgi:hypothetical protein